MSIGNNYFRRTKKAHIDENDKEVKKYSKVSLYAGTIGLTIATINYLFTGEPTPQTLTEPFNHMNVAQLIDTAIFDISSFGYFGGGIMYALSSFLEKDDMELVERKTKSELEKELEDYKNELRD